MCGQQKPQQGEQTGIPQDAEERIQRLRQYLLEKDGYSKLDDLSEQFLCRGGQSPTICAKWSGSWRNLG